MEVALFGKVSDEEEQESSAPDLATISTMADVDLSLVFVNEWLRAISDAVAGLVLRQVVAIRKLSTKGAAQLVVDLDYLV